MTFNAVIDLPTMMLLLLLAMFYPIRKDYTVVYRTYSFVTIYLVQLITYLKIMHDVLIGIDFVQSYLNTYPGSKFAQVNNLLFGGIKRDRPLQEILLYFFFTFSCLFCTQHWRTVKWW